MPVKIVSRLMRNPAAAIHADVAYSGGGESTGWDILLDGRNLTDEEAHSHTSYVRNYAPFLGRAIAAGFRMFF